MSFKRVLAKWLDKVWYKQSPWALLFYPLSGLYWLVFQWQKQKGLKARLSATPAAVPVIVVGNITVGGTGKTPLTLALLKLLEEWGWQPGVISRGYGARPPHLPYQVANDDEPELAGDEPLLIRRQSGCPVVVDPDRRQALAYLVKNLPCNIVISDDGLQHHRLARDLEIVVIDGQRRLGNGRCLPAGPMREPASRLDTVDFVVSNGSRIPEAPYTFSLKPVCFAEVGGSRTLALNAFSGQSVFAVAGIGNPQRFFDVLAELDIYASTHAFPDHYHYQSEDFTRDETIPLLMTAKDAVKCADLGLVNAWYLQVEAEPEEKFLQDFKRRIDTFVARRMVFSD